MARILERLAEHGPCSRSRLQRAAGLNYDIFRRYIDLLVDRGHIAVPEDKIAITDKGRALQAELMEWLRRFFGTAP